MSCWLNTTSDTTNSEAKEVIPKPNPGQRTLPQRQWWAILVNWKDDVWIHPHIYPTQQEANNQALSMNRGGKKVKVFPVEPAAGWGDFTPQNLWFGKD